MPLTVIKGPPNSGRTEQVRREYMDLLPAAPILVVPSVDDIFDWEKRLARDREAFVGARIMHFKDLISEVLDLKPGTRQRVASPLEREHMVDRAFAEAWPELVGRIRRQTGLAESALKLIDELRQALVDPDSLEERLPEVQSDYLSKVAAVYRQYVESLASRGVTDNPALAMASAKVNLDQWQGRPVFLVGFDDLTDQQLELTVRLGEQTAVTVAITHEDGNPAMAVTDTLLARLKARGAKVRETTARPVDPPDHSQLLYEVEKNFMRLGQGDLLTPDDSISVMRSSGRRGEAEAVAAKIACLVDEGVDPGEIAIGVSSPGTQGRLFRDLLTEYSIPASLESETSASDTAVGRAILSLLKASRPTGSAAELIQYLRGPTGQDPDLVDQLEYQVVRTRTETARAAAEMHARNGGAMPPGWDEMTGQDTVATTVAGVAMELAGNVLAHDTAGLPSDATVTEIRIAKAIGAACEELESMDDVNADGREIASAITSGAVKTWAVPTTGAVRISSPYSLRAKRFEHLFMVSLQEGGMGPADRSGPFLNSDVRAQIGLPEFVDPELQELYLFYSCLSVPTKGLWLSSRVADDSGKAEHPSPLVTAIERMFPEGSIRRGGRSAEEISFPADKAPSLVELARSIAVSVASGQNPEIQVPDLGEVGDPEAIRGQIENAIEIESHTRTLNSVSPEIASALLAENTTFSATALEAYASCPYKWFIERAVRPIRFGPEPEPIAKGQLVHEVLAKVYRRRPGQLPGNDDVDEWIRDVEEAVVEVSSREGIKLDSDSATHIVVRRQCVAAISRFLRIESQRESSPFRPQQTEAAFGMRGEEPADMGGWSLRGSIDRIDVSAGGSKGIVIDYKTGATGVLALPDIHKQRKLQVQLYMFAMKQLLEIEPVAGLYIPIVLDPKGARGIVNEASAADLADLDSQKADITPDIGEEIGDAVIEARAIVERIVKGDIGHSHMDCLRHFEHPAVPDPLLEEILLSETEAGP